jgi:hypothetical protein
MNDTKIWRLWTDSGEQVAIFARALIAEHDLTRSTLLAKLSEARKDTKRLDVVTRLQLVLTHTKDVEYWGVSQVYRDDDRLDIRTTVRPVYSTPREAIDAAIDCLV